MFTASESPILTSSMCLMVPWSSWPIGTARRQGLFLRRGQEPQSL